MTALSSSWSPTPPISVSAANVISGDFIFTSRSLITALNGSGRSAAAEELLQENLVPRGLPTSNCFSSRSC